MLVTAVGGLLLGAVLGLKFNLKMIGHVIVASTICWMSAALLGKLTIGNAFLYGLIAAVALQAGYFVSLLIAMLGLSDEAPVADQKRAADPAPFDAASELQNKS